MKRRRCQHRPLATASHEWGVFLLCPLMVLCRFTIIIICQLLWLLQLPTLSSYQDTSKPILLPDREAEGDRWESHHGCAAEKDVVADGREEIHALLQSVLYREDGKWHSAFWESKGVVECRSYRGMVFNQGHVVAAERHHKQHGPDILKATDPLPPLRPLASNVIHPAQRDRRAKRSWCVYTYSHSGDLSI